jgi:hypothetical protein
MPLPPRPSSLLHLCPCNPTQYHSSMQPIGRLAPQEGTASPRPLLAQGPSLDIEEAQHSGWKL